MSEKESKPKPGAKIEYIAGNKLTNPADFTARAHEALDLRMDALRKKYGISIFEEEKHDVQDRTRLATLLEKGLPQLHADELSDIAKYKLAIRIGYDKEGFVVQVGKAGASGLAGKYVEMVVGSETKPDEILELITDEIARQKKKGWFRR